jgi:protoheme IX farnesyltransferase
LIQIKDDVGRLRYDARTVVAVSRTAPSLTVVAPLGWSARAAAVFALTKPRLAAMSVLTTMVAYATARPAPGTVFATLLGTSLAAAGALSLNQWWERRADALMDRTRGRPLPQGSITPREALVWSVAFSAVGIGLLAARVNLAAAALAATTILLYGLVYTPLKRRTRWATEVGSISGALPALLGNAAAGDLWSHSGVALTVILLFWQMPHFFAIGWKYRADYRRAGFRVLPAIDEHGARTAAWSLGYAMALVIASLLPCALGWLGGLYGMTAAMAGTWFLWSAGCFVVERSREAAARRLFFTTLWYLPLMMGALIIEQLFSR